MHGNRAAAFHVRDTGCVLTAATARSEGGKRTNPARQRSDEGRPAMRRKLLLAGFAAGPEELRLLV